eukprot:8214165-Pyramimonas_sp.AAC.1
MGAVHRVAPRELPVAQKQPERLAKLPQVRVCTLQRVLPRLLQPVRAAGACLGLCALSELVQALP